MRSCTDLLTLLENGGAAAAMNRAIDAPATEQRGIGRVHDGVHFLLRDVALDQP